MRRRRIEGKKEDLYMQKKEKKRVVPFFVVMPIFTKQDGTLLLHSHSKIVHKEKEKTNHESTN